MRRTNGRVLKIVGWGTPAVIVAAMVVQRIALGPACFAIDCTGSTATPLASDVFAWLVSALVIWAVVVAV